MSLERATTGDHVLHWARAYDVLVRVLTLGRERKFRQHLVELARLAPGESALDVGCGTGALALAAKDAVGPDGRVQGIDPSPEMVARASRKAAKASLDVAFETAAVEALPFPEATFDVVLSSLMLHHLTEEGLRQGVAEIARVLKPGGRFLAVDIGGGTKGHRHGTLHRMRKHASFDLEEVAPTIEAARLRIVERGLVGGPRLLGVSNLRFLMARLHG